MAKQKSGLTLPQNVGSALSELHENRQTELLADYVALLRNAGWTLESMAVPLGLTRERVRQLAKSCESLELAQHFMVARGWEVPELPDKAPRYVRKTPVPMKPDSAVVERMLEIKATAESVRWKSANGRREAEEYISLMAGEIKRGVSVYAMAKALGVTPLAVRSRLSRYGYLPVPENGSEKYKSMFAPLEHRA